MASACACKRLSSRLGKASGPPRASGSMEQFRIAMHHKDRCASPGSGLNSRILMPHYCRLSKSQATKTYKAMGWLFSVLFGTKVRLARLQKSDQFHGVMRRNIKLGFCLAARVRSLELWISESNDGGKLTSGMVGSSDVVRYPGEFAHRSRSNRQARMLDMDLSSPHSECGADQVLK